VHISDCIVKDTDLFYSC